MANEKRLIDANALNDSKWWESLTDDFDKARARIIVMSAPTVQAVEVVHGYKVGDVCFYGFHDGNKSLALVEIVKILSDERGCAEVKFLKVFVDNTGNGFFNYLLRSGNTMNASFKYLKNITPVGAKMDGGNEDGNL